MRIKILADFNLADWSQPVRIKILADFNLVDGRVRLSHALNLQHVHVCLRSLRGVASSRLHVHVRLRSLRGVASS